MSMTPFSPATRGAGHCTTPKTLAERFQWMADNLPGFREELDAVREIERRQYAKSCTAAPARSEARTAAAVQRAATPPLSNTGINGGAA